MKQFLGERVTLFGGDSRDVLKNIPDNTLDSIVTDPPYALVSIVKRFGNQNAAPAKEYEGKTGAYRRASAGFMGKQWDTGEVAFDPEFWVECLRVLKPGGHVISFGGTRTFHRMACAIEDAGFEIRDMIQWLYGTGFPKSHSVGDGWGTALKPANEPICLARKPLSEKTVAANVLKWGTGALNIDACRIEFKNSTDETESKNKNQHAKFGSGTRNNNVYGVDHADRTNYNAPGRWPANVIHDGSDEVTQHFPNSKSSGGQSSLGAFRNGDVYGKGLDIREKKDPGFGDDGSAARFFYSAKASKRDRAGSKHPTVKPINLLRHLIRMITPPGGIVLDPFAGSGTTGEAAYMEGMQAILIEREAEYQNDIENRLSSIVDIERILET